MKTDSRRRLLSAMAIVIVAIAAFALVVGVQAPPRVEFVFIGYTNQVTSGTTSATIQPQALFKVENKSDRMLGVVATQLEVRTKHGWQDVGAPVVHPGVGLVSFPADPATFGWPEPGAASAWRLRLTLKALCGAGHSVFRSKTAELLRNQGITGLADQLYFPTWSLRSPEVIRSSLGRKSSP